ncbi:ankyrin and HET domain-containing protein [Paramyrothecium foliicola]|nr:ankyrin and HET domain-containing protein [Paramyrothecium foliicola]
MGKHINNKPHEFVPLTGPRQTRILHLDPSSVTSIRITGRLETVDLDAKPSYEALSYEWGSPDKDSLLHLDDGTAISITGSLHHALRDIRHEDASRGARALWVDAACINQADIEELQTQVAMMGSIYRQASRVVTYIGPEKDDSAEGIRLATKLHHHCTSLNGKSDPRVNSSDGLVSLGLPPLSNRHWKPLRALILRTWASRCWCAQEFLLNENLLMLCGRTPIPDWRLMPEIVQFVFDRLLSPFFLPGSDKDPNSMRECLSSLGRLRRYIVYQGAQLNLLDLLNRCHPFRASDPRDKVYSVLGLASDADIVKIKIDYTCTPEQLYVAVAARIVETDPNLEILYGNLHTKSLALPSWVPDWSTWHFGSNGAACACDYASGGLMPPELRVRGPKLDVTGCLVDRIASLSQPLGPLYKNYDQRATSTRQEWLRREMANFRARPGSDSDEWIDPFAAFWRTLIGDITFDEEPAQADYAAYFHAHLHVREDSARAVKSMAREFCDAVRRRSRYRRLALTKRDARYGAVPETAAVGDWVCMFNGGEHLFVVRPTDEEGEFTFLGHAYVHGLMKGEVLEADWYRSQTITLV